MKTMAVTFLATAAVATGGLWATVRFLLWWTEEERVRRREAARRVAEFRNRRW